MCGWRMKRSILTWWTLWSHYTITWGKTFNSKVISGGDQLTCEWQFCAQRHLMDGDNPYDCLQNVEPVSEDWHSLMNLLMVSLWTIIIMYALYIIIVSCSLPGRNCMQPHQEIMAQFVIFVASYDTYQWQKTQEGHECMCRCFAYCFERPLHSISLWDI